MNLRTSKYEIGAKCVEQFLGRRIVGRHLRKHLARGLVRLELFRYACELHLVLMQVPKADREQFDERRMLGIHAEIGILPVTNSRKNMTGFVKRLGLVANRQREFCCHYSQQQHDADRNAHATRHKWLGISHDSKRDEEETLYAPL